VALAGTTACQGGLNQIGSWVEEGSQGTWTLTDTLNTEMGWEVNDWTSISDPDPFVTNDFVFTNTTGATQTFTVVTSIGISPSFSSSIISGSVAGSFADTPGGGAGSVTDSGSPVYTALIDGAVTSNTLLSSLNLSPGDGLSAVIGPANFGPVPDGPVNSSIGIQIKFDLTAGDRVSFTSNFVASPIPLPATVWLFGSGLLGLVGIAKRKKS